ncbi:restriction endonuclease S subunit [Chryseobacterium sp. SORGH_AS 447]|uniref:restriction endonuclease subunit S n=1 Tax=Chryseobacterium sp. SORGH_AS_0447 TaxID=3041769 RepID=UPI002787275D|nr:restriction endonuclease subunit S [Chryseobacterium sp. SORGH_AS_0447]MDQ1161359.1 restriction endonuclease S subunit [Chryseobacterium sp. SORGH_AS_0447]
MIVDGIVNDESHLSSYIQKTKSKILDLAIRGKLVPQDPNDEPASVLLERIKSEHPESKKKAKYTRDNSHYQNLPFEIPENWSWCKLVDICSIITDGTHQTPTYSDEGYIFLSSKNVTSGKIDWENVMYIPEFLHKQLYARLAPQKGDILLAKNGTTGFSAVVDCDYIFDIYVSLALLRTFQNKINPYYLRHIMSSLFVQEQFKANLKGIGVPNLHLENIRNTYVPICSLKEQNEIVSKIDQLFEVLDNIAAEL